MLHCYLIGTTTSKHLKNVDIGQSYIFPENSDTINKMYYMQYTVTSQEGIARKKNSFQISIYCLQANFKILSKEYLLVIRHQSPLYYSNMLLFSMTALSS